MALTASAPTIRPGERLSSAAQLMIEHNRQAIAVVNQASRLLGVVTEEMVLRTMLDAMGLDAMGLDAMGLDAMGLDALRS